jgi:hypothetical protein
MVALERRAESHASTVKKDALIGLRRLENATDLFGAPAFEVAQGYDGAPEFVRGTGWSGRIPLDFHTIVKKGGL